MFGEVMYYTRLAVGEGDDLQFTNVAVVRMFTRPNVAMLHESHSTVAVCEATDTFWVLNIRNILSVIALVPKSFQLADGTMGECYFVVEKAGLNVSYFLDGRAGQMVDDDDDAGMDVE